MVAAEVQYALELEAGQSLVPGQTEGGESTPLCYPLTFAVF